jgi:hypothetical protein
MKYRTTVVWLSGGWKDSPAGNTYKGAVEQAFHQSLLPHVRYVSITRRMRNGLHVSAGTVASDDHRVFLTVRGSLNNFYYFGEEPDPATCKEITGRFERVPPSYSI